jgi:hypothetical protein
MTREQAKELLPVIAAWAEGLDIEFKRPEDKYWVLFDPKLKYENPNFECNNCIWRAKSTP